MTNFSELESAGLIRNGKITKGARKAMREAKATDKRIEQLFYQRCNRIQISVLDIPKVFKVGRASAAAGDNDQVLGDKIAAYVETIRKDRKE